MALVLTCTDPAVPEYADQASCTSVAWVQQASWFGESLSLEDAATLTQSVLLLFVIAWGFKFLRRQLLNR